MTRSGSAILDDTAPATMDAVAVARLRAAGGARMIGRTTMTELAYSGLGLNPHDGTRRTAVCGMYSGGGSSSGGAVSVAAGLADIALGGVTRADRCAFRRRFAGSQVQANAGVRAAHRGAMPLSESLDSAGGPMARDVAGCAAAWQVMAGRAVTDLPAERRELIVPKNFGMSDLDPVVAQGFAALRRLLVAKGWQVAEADLPVLARYPSLPVWQFSAVESLRRFGPRVEADGAKMDLRVRQRMMRGGARFGGGICGNLRAPRRDDHRVSRATWRGFAAHAHGRDPAAALCGCGDGGGLYPPEPAGLAQYQPRQCHGRVQHQLPFGQGAGLIGAMLTGAGGQDEALLGAALALESDMAEG